MKKRIHIASEHPEYTKERIYGAITILATNIGIFTHLNEHSTVKWVFTTIATTALGLWLASIFSEIIAEKIAEKYTNWKNPFTHQDKKELFKNSLGILHSAGFPTFMLSLAYFNIINLKAAVFSSIISAVISIVFFIFLAYFRRENNILFSLIILAIQFAVFFLIISLKLAH